MSSSTFTTVYRNFMFPLYTREFSFLSDAMVTMLFGDAFNIVIFSIGTTVISSEAMDISLLRTADNFTDSQGTVHPNYRYGDYVLTLAVVIRVAGGVVIGVVVSTATHVCLCILLLLLFFKLYCVAVVVLMMLLLM